MISTTIAKMYSAFKRLCGLVILDNTVHLSDVMYSEAATFIIAVLL